MQTLLLGAVNESGGSFPIYALSFSREARTLPASSPKPPTWATLPPPFLPTPQRRHRRRRKRSPWVSSSISRNCAGPSWSPPWPTWSSRSWSAISW